MNAGKSILARAAFDLVDNFAITKLWQRIHNEFMEVRSDSLDRAFLATKQGRLNEPPYVSLRQ